MTDLGDIFDKYSKMSINRRNLAWERFRTLYRLGHRHDIVAFELLVVKKAYYDQFLNNSHQCLFGAPCREETCEKFSSCTEDSFYRAEFKKLKDQDIPWFGDARYLAPLLNPRANKLVKLAIIRALTNPEAHKAFAESVSCRGYFKFLYAKMWKGIEIYEPEA